jgi:hypothetical protein
MALVSMETTGATARSEASAGNGSEIG